MLPEADRTVKWRDEQEKQKYCQVHLKRCTDGKERKKKKSNR